MAKQNETTTKFKVDISELVSGMAQAKRQIALANAEFKSATAGMDNWSKSADGISAKLSQLDKTLSNQKSILSSLEDQYRLTAEQMGADSKEAENLRIKIENQKASIGKTEKEIRNYRKALSDLESGTDGASDGLEDVADSAQDAGKSAEESAGGFTVLKGAMASLVADGIKAMSGALKDLVTDSANAYAQFSANTGIATEAMGKYEDAIKNVYKHNFGESLEDVANKMAKVKEVTGELDAGQLEKMTEKAITLEDTFGMDMTETLRGVQSLMTHFGMTSEQAFDYISAGAQNGLNYTDELGDNLSEYAGKFAEAGYTTEEYFQLLKNGSQGGSYNLDKVNDSINEITARLADGTIGDSINMYSKDTQDLFTAWQNGEATQKQVIDSIVKDIQNTTNEQEKMNLSAKAFGTMAEDGGTKFIESLSSVGDTFTDVTGKAEDLANTKYDTPMASMQSIGRTLKVELLQPIVDKLNPALSKLANWMTKNLPAFTKKVKEVAKEFKNWIPTLALIGSSITTYLAVTKIMAFVKAIKSGELALKAMAIAQKALNLVMSANPIGLVITAITTLVGAFIYLWNTSEEFRNFWINLWEKVKEITSTVVSAIGEFFSNLWTDIVAIWSTVSGWFNDNVIQPLVSFFTGLWNTLSGIFSAIWSTIVTIFSPAFSWFSKLFTSVYNTLKSIVSVILGLLRGVWNSIKIIFSVVGSWFNDHVIQPVARFFSGLWNGIKNGASTAWSAVSGTFKSVASWFNTHLIQPVAKFFSGLWGTFSSKASQAWGAVKSVFSKVGEFFSKVFGDAWAGVVKVFSVGGEIFTDIKDGILTGFKWVVNKLIKGINKVVSIPFKGINSVLKKIKNIELFGSKPFEDMIDTINIPEIPELYRGGVLKKGQMGLLEGNGDEAVVPLDHNTGWLDEVAKRIVAKGGMTGAQAQTVNNNYNYEYNQTNNSPKALNRLEIYRQTRNQFNYATGGAI